MRLGVRTIDHVGLVVRITSQFTQYPLKDTTLIPSREARMDRFPWTEMFRQVTPGNTRFRDVEDRVQEHPVGQLRWPPLLSRPLWRK